MKKLIDAYALSIEIEKSLNESGTIMYNFEVRDLIEHIINIQPIVLCVTDDFESDCGTVCMGCKFQKDVIK